MDIEDPDYVARNRRVWNVGTGLRGRGRRRRGPPMSQPGGLCGAGCRAGAAVSVDGLDVIELGCGTAYVSSWLKRRGAQPVGDRHLPGAARHCPAAATRAWARFELHRGNAEATPFPNAASTWRSPIRRLSLVRPYTWIPEASHLLRPRGRADLPDERHARDARACPETDAEGPANAAAAAGPTSGCTAQQWPGRIGSRVPPGLRRLDPRSCARTGFEIELDMIEIQPPEGATTSFAIVTPQWARQRPSEEIWKAHKR